MFSEASHPLALVTAASANFVSVIAMLGASDSVADFSSIKNRWANNIVVIVIGGPRAGLAASDDREECVDALEGDAGGGGSDLERLYRCCLDVSHVQSWPT
jgi:hypothetical protein